VASDLPMAIGGGNRAARLEALLSRITRGLYRLSDEDPFTELPIAQLRILRILFAEDRTPSELGHDLGLSVSAITQIANRLCTVGLVERRKDADDRRTRPLTLSEKGLQLMKRRRQHRVARVQSVLACIPEGRQEEILAVFEELASIGQHVPLGAGDESLLATAELELALPPSFRPDPAQL
jgi:DNA-binding MarR family transcriptional regulator